MCQRLRAALGGTSLRHLPGLVGPCRHSEAWLLCVGGGFLRKNVLPPVFCGSVGPVPQPPEIGVLSGQNSVLYAPGPTGEPGPGIHHLPAWHNHPALTHTRVCTCMLLKADEGDLSDLGSLAASPWLVFQGPKTDVLL